MDIELASHGDVSVVKVRGRLVDGQPADSFREILTDLLDDDKAKIVLQVDELSWLDSTAIGILVSLHGEASRGGGKILLLGASERIRRLFDLTRLTPFFSWADELDEALGRFERKDA